MKSCDLRTWWRPLWQRELPSPDWSMIRGDEHVVGLVGEGDPIKSAPAGREETTTG